MTHLPFPSAEWHDRQQCPNGGRCIELAGELAAERIATKLACGESVDLRAENQKLCADVLSLEQQRDELEVDVAILTEQVRSLNERDVRVTAERDVLRRVAIAAAADPFPTPETRTAIYEWWAATSATQDTSVDTVRETGRNDA